MADTTFVDGSTTVVASWLNDVNDATYTTVPAHSATLASGVVLKDSSTGGAQIPSGTTAQRPGTPVGTLLRYNTTISNWEGYNGSVWGLLASGFAASGANVDITSLGNNTSTIYTTAGTSTAYTITPSPVISAYTIGQSFVVNFNATSGASPTLQISGVASPPNLVKMLPDGTYSNVLANDIQANHRSRVTLISTTQALVEDLNPVVSMVRLDTQGAGAAGNGTTNTKIPRWTNVRTNTGSAITYTDSVANGTSLTTNAPGIYSINFTHSAGSAEGFCITLNESGGTLNSSAAFVAVSEVLQFGDTAAANFAETVSWTGYLASGSVIRPHTSGGLSSAPRSMFTMVKIG